MLFIRNASIQRKLTLVIFFVSVLGLSMTCLAFEVYERAIFRSSMISELSAHADMLGLNTAASLTFNDRDSALNLLAALRIEHHIVAACTYDRRGNIFAEYRRAGAGKDLMMPAWHEDGEQSGPDALTLYRSISLNGEKIGSIALVSDYSALAAKMKQFRETSALVLIVSILVTALVSSRLVRLITEPILQLAGIAAKVSANEDYTLRGLPGDGDEVGTLVSSFNQMLERIQERDAALQGAKEKLELRVQARTEAEGGCGTQAGGNRNAPGGRGRGRSQPGEERIPLQHEPRNPHSAERRHGDDRFGARDAAYSGATRIPGDREDVGRCPAYVINDILDFSKIEAGSVDLESIDFNLRDCLEMSLKTLALSADEKGLELLCEVAPEVPEVVRGDSGRLPQVIINLAGNAIKFTDRGEVALKVQVEASNEHDCTLRFTVADSGIGIPKEKLQSIFDPFSQADTSMTRKYGGTGLGLTISSRLVGMMGGRIWVESELGRGSQFHFTTRLGIADTKVIEVGAIAPPEILRAVKVLVVDDNRTNRRILEGMLNRWEMKVTCVEGGDEALAQLCAALESGKPYGLVLTDMHMPGMDGFALVERIRRRPELSTATIMMLTSAGHRGDAARCQELGVSAYLLKPIRQSELREAIARVLGAKEQKGAIPLITRYSLQDAREPTGSLRVLVAEDNLVNQRLVTRLLEKRGHFVVVAGNGREALVALEKESFDLVLMDVQMPVMDGFEATAAIRKREGGKGIRVPVVALTAHAMKGDREKCLAGGMDGYLTKPIRPQQLDELLEKYLARRAETAEAQESTLSKK